MAGKKPKKRELIIEAFFQSVIEQGLASSSMGDIAIKVGIDRSSLYYYFKSREELIDALTEYVVEQYLNQFHSALSSLTNSHERAMQLLEHLFGGKFHQPKLARVIDELSTAGNQEKHIAVHVKMIYMSIETAIVKELELGFPDAEPETRKSIAYAIHQLAEGCSVLTALGFSPNRLEAGKFAALQLLAVLEAA